MEAYVNKEIMKEFVNQLLTKSNGLISEREALELANKYFSTKHIYEGSPLSHKGISILVTQILSTLNK